MERPPPGEREKRGGVLALARAPRAHSVSPAMSRALFALVAILPSVTTRWCQLENVKTDPDKDFTFSGPWRLDGCTTLELDHGKCDEEDCPHRVALVDEEGIELADALHGNTVLTAISLAANKITDESAKALAESLRDNEVLNELNLMGNEIGDEGAAAIAEVFQTNPVFTLLNLEANQIGDEGGKAILDLLKSNTSALEIVYIENNKMAKWIEEEVAEEVRLNQEIPEEAMKMVEESRKGLTFDTFDPSDFKPPPPPPKLPWPDEL